MLDALSDTPVVFIRGARQTGKSTLVSAPPLGKSRTYRSLDYFDILDANYQADLKSMTGGEGAYTMEFDHYDVVPSNIQKTIEAEYEKEQAEK